MYRKLTILALSAASISAMSIPLQAQNAGSQMAPTILAQAEDPRVAEMNQRLAKLRNALEAAQSDEERQQLAERIATLERRIAKVAAEAGDQAAQPPAADEAAQANADGQPKQAAEENFSGDGAQTAENRTRKKKQKMATQPDNTEQSAEISENQPVTQSKTESVETPAAKATETPQPKVVTEQDADVKPTAAANAETEAEAQMTPQDKELAKRRKERREARRAKRQEETEKADDIQTALQTIEAIKPTAKVQIVEEDGRQVQKQQFRSNDGRIVEKRIRTNRDGDKIVITKVTRADGTVVERKRVIDRIDSRDDRHWKRYKRHDRRSESGVDVVINIPLGVDIAPDRYVVDGRGAPPEIIYDVLHAEPVRQVERRYTIDEVTQSEQVRSLVPRIDLDTINFQFGQAEVPDGQIRNLDKIAAVMEDVLAKNPSEVFLLEGHTDAVGSELYNLQLSELRAQSVKYALVDGFGLPEDAFVTEGYGEEYLKVPTEQPERLNRRVTVRRITTLVQN